MSVRNRIASFEAHNDELRKATSPTSNSTASATTASVAPLLSPHSVSPRPSQSSSRQQKQQPVVFVPNNHSINASHSNHASSGLPESPDRPASTTLVAKQNRVHRLQRQAAAAAKRSPVLSTSTTTTSSLSVTALENQQQQQHHHHHTNNNLRTMSSSARMNRLRRNNSSSGNLGEREPSSSVALETQQMNHINNNNNHHPRQQRPASTPPSRSNRQLSSSSPVPSTSLFSHRKQPLASQASNRASPHAQSICYSGSLSACPDDHDDDDDDDADKANRRRLKSHSTPMSDAAHASPRTHRPAHPRDNAIPKDEIIIDFDGQQPDQLQPHHVNQSFSSSNSVNSGGGGGGGDTLSSRRSSRLRQLKRIHRNRANARQTLFHATTGSSSGTTTATTTPSSSPFPHPATISHDDDNNHPDEHRTGIPSDHSLSRNAIQKKAQNQIRSQIRRNSNHLSILKSHSNSSSTATTPPPPSSHSPSLQSPTESQTPTTTTPTPQPSRSIRTDQDDLPAAPMTPSPPPPPRLHTDHPNDEDIGLTSVRQLLGKGGSNNNNIDTANVALQQAPDDERRLDHHQNLEQQQQHLEHPKNHHTNDEMLTPVAAARRDAHEDGGETPLSSSSSRLWGEEKSEKANAMTGSSSLGPAPLAPTMTNLSPTSTTSSRKRTHSRNKNNSIHTMLKHNAAGSNINGGSGGGARGLIMTPSSSSEFDTDGDRSLRGGAASGSAAAAGANAALAHHNHHHVVAVGSTGETTATGIVGRNPAWNAGGSWGASGSLGPAGDHGGGMREKRATGGDGMRSSRDAAGANSHYAPLLQDPSMTASQLTPDVAAFFDQRQKHKDDDDTYDYSGRDEDNNVYHRQSRTFESIRDEEDDSQVSLSYAQRLERQAKEEAARKAAAEAAKANMDGPFMHQEDVEHYRKSLDSPAVKLTAGVAAAATLGCIMLGPVGLLVGAAAVGIGVGFSQIPEEQRNNMQDKAAEALKGAQESAFSATEAISNSCAYSYRESGIDDHVPLEMKTCCPAIDEEVNRQKQSRRAHDEVDGTGGLTRTENAQANDGTTGLKPHEKNATSPTRFRNNKKDNIAVLREGKWHLVVASWLARSRLDQRIALHFTLHV